MQTSNRPIVSVVGSINVDFIVRVPHIPLPGETGLGKQLQRIAGGKGANQSLAVRRLGAEAYLIGCIGDDALGEEAILTLQKEGVHLDYLRRIEGACSGVALIAVADSGENSIVVAPEANALLSLDDITAATPAIQSSSVVIAQLEVPVESVRLAFQIARQYGVTTVLNPAPAQSLDESIMALTDILICNATEAEKLTWLAVMNITGAEAAAPILLSRGPKVVVITVGAYGSIVATEQGMTFIASFSVPVLDTTGAGDTFVGAFAFCYAQGDDPITAARYANAAAALSVGSAGAQPSLPTQNEVNAFLAAQGL